MYLTENISLEERLVDLFWEGLSNYSSDVWFDSSSKEKEEILWWALAKIGEPVDKAWALKIFWMWADGIEEDAFVDFPSFVEEFKLYETMWDEKYPHGSDLINGEYEEIPNNYQADTKPHGRWVLAYNNGNNWVFYNRSNSFSDNLAKAVRYESRMDALYNRDKANKKYKEETSYRANFIAVKEDSKRLTEAGGNSKGVQSFDGFQSYIDIMLGWKIIDCERILDDTMMLNAIQQMILCVV